MHGFHGCYWRFDLSTGRGERVAIPLSVLRSYLGGVGLGSWLLYREAPEGVDPLAPERILSEPIPDGPVAGARIDHERLATMVRGYNRERGWSDDGYPSRAARGDLLVDA